MRMKSTLQTRKPLKTPFDFIFLLIFNLLVNMSGEVRKVEASSIQTNGGQTEGMVRKGAIVDMSDKLCASGTLRRL